MNLPILHRVILTILIIHSNFLLLLAQRHLLNNLLIISRGSVVPRRRIALPHVLTVLPFSLLRNQLPGFREFAAAIPVYPLLLNCQRAFYLVIVVDLLL